MTGMHEGAGAADPLRGCSTTELHASLARVVDERYRLQGQGRATTAAYAIACGAARRLRAELERRGVVLPAVRDEVP